MYPAEFPGQNVVYGRDQPEYLPLPALRMPDGEVYTFWKFSDEEWETISTNRGFFIKQLTFNGPLQPIRPIAELSDGIELLP